MIAASHGNAGKQVQPNVEVFKEKIWTHSDTIEIVKDSFMNEVVDEDHTEVDHAHRPLIKKQ